MALTIKDGLGVSKTLATGLSGSDLVPFHSISGSVSVVGTALTASLANSSLIVTSSQTNPVYVTGNVSIASGDVFVSNDQNTALWVTSSKTQPLFVVSDTDEPVVVANSAGTALFVTASKGAPLYVVSDIDKPVHVQSSIANPLFINTSSANPIHVTSSSPLDVRSSNADPLVVKSKTATTSDRAVFTPYEAINYTGSASGTFEIASASANRIGLMISNPSQLNLYISIGNDSYAATNGFYLSSVSTEPQIFSFIIYPSGTYFADAAFVTLKHGGFFVSSSNVLDQAVARVERIT